MQTRWLLRFHWEPKELWQSLPRPVLEWNSYWSLCHSASYPTLTKHDHHHPQLTDICLKSPPSFSLFLILEKHGTINKTKAFRLGVLKKSDTFPIIKNSFHLNQLQYIYLASTRHCPTALVCLGVGGLTKGQQLKRPSSCDHQNILWPRKNHSSYS